MIKFLFPFNNNLNPDNKSFFVNLFSLNIPRSNLKKLNFSN